eukprot:gene51685-17902_t
MGRRPSPQQEEEEEEEGWAEGMEENTHVGEQLCAILRELGLEGHADTLAEGWRGWRGSDRVRGRRRAAFVPPLTVCGCLFVKLRRLCAAAVRLLRPARQPRPPCPAITTRYCKRAGPRRGICGALLHFARRRLVEYRKMEHRAEHGWCSDDDDAPPTASADAHRPSRASRHRRGSWRTAAAAAPLPPTPLSASGGVLGVACALGHPLPGRPECAECRARADEP